MMTPVEMEVLLNCYYRVNGEGLGNSTAVERSLATLRRYKLIETTGYACTEKGTAHVKQLCALPFPTTQYVDFNGKEIDLRS